MRLSADASEVGMQGECTKLSSDEGEVGMQG